ncbi:MAG TPA: hypothetical protein VHE57_09645 [Mycobacteriales bacterium]|nr:hypothetical protein [Mycobacteriales bacterium]
MIFALRQPAVFLGLLLGFVVGMIALSAFLRLLERNTRHPAPVWNHQSWLDPYGAVAALLAGVGWGPRRELRRGFGRSQHRQLLLVALLSCAVPAVLGAIGLAIYAGLVGHGVLPLTGSYSVLHGFQPFATTFAEKVAVGFGIENLGVAILSLVPIPPLPTGVWAWTVFPKTPGPRQLAYRLLDEHWGIAALLLLFLIPVGGDGPALLVLVTSISDQILNLF